MLRGDWVQYGRLCISKAGVVIKIVVGKNLWQGGCDLVIPGHCNMFIGGQRLESTAPEHPRSGMGIRPGTCIRATQSQKQLISKVLGIKGVLCAYQIPFYVAVTML